MLNVQRKSAPLPERPCEQLTCCEKNGTVQGNYINRVTKRHNCRITGKTKATYHGGPSTQALRYPQRKSADYYAATTSGWQCDQCAGLLVGYSCSLTLPCRDVFQVCDPIFVRLYPLRNVSRTKAHGANLSDSCSCAIFLRRPFRVGDGVLVDSLLVILCTCKAMRRSSSHHGAGDGYSCSLALRRWRRLISPRMAVTINCASVSFSSLTKFISLKTSRGILAVFCCDLLLVVPVGITGLLTVRWRSVYVEKKIKKGLKCKSPKSSIIFKGDLHLKDKARRRYQHQRASNHQR